MKPIKYAQKDNRIFPYCDLNFSGFVNSGIHRKSIVNKIIVGSDSKFYVTDIYHYVMSKGFATNKIDIERVGMIY